ncbi:class I SAM-dependent methyltransferase [Pedobacter sp. MR22-3]|uniref:class I SAM-dependent methyltransferase n=1 Tax=Pedobacter sp. MR22-3 TaxID=2994552 RepID=UPI002246BC2B|nr:class I SAM-dependent methyltransferase [Pedobacter sp. MR22-3]MCX2585038.1 class I SAM-dependent methyltransferase [Pedobacter sp. MR22-3]
MKEIYLKKDVSYYSHTRIEMLKFLPKSFRTVLDVGCATGNFGQILKQHYSCEVWGVEPDENSAVIARKNLDKVYCGVFDETIEMLATKQFDCIFFNDVLEHLSQPDEALRIAKKYLLPDGCVIASIPNIRYYPVILSLLRYKDFEYVDAGVMDKTHLRFFTKKSMVRLFEEQGYEIQVIEGINRNHFKFLSLINFFSFKSVDDMHFPQFVLVAKNK